MPELQATLRAPWKAASAVQSTLRVPWRDAAPVQSRGWPFTPSPPPPGGSPIEPESLAPGAEILAADAYLQEQTVEVIDLRTGEPLDFDRVAIDFSDGSALWTLQATGGPGLYATLTGGEQPATMRVTFGGRQWAFVVDAVSRQLQHNAGSVSVRGLSLAAAAGSPYQLERNWIIDSPTTAAQLANAAQAFTGVEIDWRLEDWLIPAGAWSMTGTPLAVAQAVAQAAGGMVIADPLLPRLSFVPRFPAPPSEWSYIPPDVQIAWQAIEADSFEAADQPGYTGVIVSGQQQGGLATVKLEGTSGTEQAPLVTDPLLTDEPALRQRGAAVLFAGGPQARVTRTLPVRSGAGEPGVLLPGQLVRFVDDDAIWVGVVRGVSVQAGLGSARQTVSMERRTGAVVSGEEIVPLVFEGPIPDQQANVGVPFAVALAPFWTQGVGARTYSLRSGTLPTGLALDPVTGAINGTGTVVETKTGIRVRAVDTVGNMADSNAFQIAVVPDDPLWAFVTLLLRGDGANGSTTIVDESSAGHVMTAVGNAALTSTNPKHGPTAIGFDGTGDRVSTPSDAGLRLNTGLFSVELWFRVTGTGKVLIGCFNGSTVGWQILVNGLSQFVFQVFKPDNTSAFQIVASGAALNNGAWHHAVAQRADASTFELLVDGTLRGTAAYAGDIRGDGTYSLSVGARGDSASSMLGAVDDVRITHTVKRYAAPYVVPGPL